MGDFGAYFEPCFTDAQRVTNTDPELRQQFRCGCRSPEVVALFQQFDEGERRCGLECSVKGIGGFHGFEFHETARCLCVFRSCHRAHFRACRNYSRGIQGFAFLSTGRAMDDVDQQITSENLAGVCTDALFQHGPG